MCLASSKFLALKLLDLVDPAKHVFDFLRSGWARAHANLDPASCWGGSMERHNDTFNREVLPAAVNDPVAGVKNPSTSHYDVCFQYFFHQPTVGDDLLRKGTPLIVGVSLHGTGGRDHFIVIAKARDGSIWAVDPWPGSGSDAVKPLRPDLTFTRKTSIHLTADAVKTDIPCGVPFFGYFRDSDLESRYVFPMVY
jgi:hypothetical protein